MNVLCIDTSSVHGVVALAQEGAPLAQCVLDTGQRQSTSLVDRIRDVLHSAQLEPQDVDLLGVGLGPGGFTRVRVGIASAKGLSLACGTPIVGVGSLAVLARGFPSSRALRVCIRRAYRGEVYAAAYRLGPQGLQQVVAPCHGKPEEIAQLIAAHPIEGEMVVGGCGWIEHQAILAPRWPSDLEAVDPKYNTPQSEALIAEVLARHRDAGADELGALEPAYLRSSDARLPNRPHAS